MGRDTDQTVDHLKRQITALLSSFAQTSHGQAQTLALLVVAEELRAIREHLTTLKGRAK